MNSETVTSEPGLISALSRAELNTAGPHLMLLRNEQLVTMLTASGSGYVQFEKQAVTRWNPDPTRDAAGYFIYLRDLESNRLWSSTYQPTRVEPDDYRVEFRLGSAKYTRKDDDLQTQLEVFLAADEAVEFRQLTLTNTGTSTRKLELTSYAELVLQDARADAGHLAYSKLFVETWQHESGALCARRRPREAGASTVSACHFLVGIDASATDGFETDRARFLGRGNTVENPAALHVSDAPSGQLGSVLDPIFSLRKCVTIPAGKSVCVTFALASGTESTDYARVIERYQTPESVVEAHSGALAAARDFVPATENDASLLRQATSALYGTAIPADREPDSANQIAKFLDHFDIPFTPEVISSQPVSSNDARSAASAQPVNDSPSPSEVIEVTSADFDETLQHDNGIGGFTMDGSEYVLRLRPNEQGQTLLPPMPWANIISNEKIGFIASETGAGYTWASNSRLNRLTPWQNDPVSDPHGEAIYLRDEDDRQFWSATPGPIRQSIDYEVRHGIGYSHYRHTSNGLLHDVCQFVPVDDSIKISWVRLKNDTGKTRHISILSYVNWDLSDGDWQASRATTTSIDQQCNTIVARNDRRGVFAENTAFSKLVAPSQASQVQLTCDRREFLGPNGSLSSPQAVAGNTDLSGRSGSGFDQCAASKTTLEIAPGEAVQFAVLLGETSSLDGARELVTRYSNPSTWSATLAEVKSAWKERLSAVQIDTPCSAINLMVNGWLPYQNLSCRVWGRSSLYQSGGAYGYRDQLQDAAALMHHLPELTRQQIVRHAGHQFVEGDVMHWWHPPHSLGIRTTFSDDLLWLPLFAAEYVAATGDKSLWDEQVSFRRGEQLPPGEPEMMLAPEVSDESASVYEHCCRSLDRGLTSGRNGLPLMGCGDWNDGMNRVGVRGTGESVWMGFFIDFILGKMLPVCEQFEDQARLERYLTYREQLRAALHDAGWDGGWYRRAYFDDGTPLGTAAADECQIDALVQAWAVLSGADTHERATKAMQAAAARLVDQQAGLIQLLDPPFDKMDNDPGYIKGYLPGVRENGGQYTHGVLWFIRAMAELGEGTQAAQLLEMISPVSHTDSPEGVSIYKAEPYVVAADVYSQDPHAGRAGWSWYTGSAGWMWRVAVETILGITLLDGDKLCINPRMSAEWPECRVKYRLADRKTVYEILIRNPNRRESGVASCELENEPLPVENNMARVPLTFDGQTHRVTVTL